MLFNEFSGRRDGWLTVMEGIMEVAFLVKTLLNSYHKVSGCLIVATNYRVLTLYPATARQALGVQRDLVKSPGSTLYTKAHETPNASSVQRGGLIEIHGQRLQHLIQQPKLCQKPLHRLLAQQYVYFFLAFSLSK